MIATVSPRGDFPFTGTWAPVRGDYSTQRLLLLRFAGCSADKRAQAVRWLAGLMDLTLMPGQEWGALLGDMDDHTYRQWGITVAHEPDDDSVWAFRTPPMLDVPPPPDGTRRSRGPRGVHRLLTEQEDALVQHVRGNCHDSTACELCRVTR